MLIGISFSTNIGGGDEGQGVLADLGVVSKGEEIVAEAKRDWKGKVESERVGVRRDFFEKAHAAGDGNMQFVLWPRDERLFASWHLDKLPQDRNILPLTPLQKRWYPFSDTLGGSS